MKILITKTTYNKEGTEVEFVLEIQTKNIDTHSILTDHPKLEQDIRQSIIHSLNYYLG